MNREIEIRPYSPGDETAILALFEKSFGRSMEMEFWRWRFADNPTGEVFIDLAWAGPELAAHYAVSPVAMQVDGADVRTALSMTTMTDPRFRGQGLFQELARSVYGRMRDAGVAMVWGFPNANSHRGFIRDLNWKDVYEVPTFRVELGSMRSPAGAGAGVVDLNEFDVRYDTLWNRVRGSARVAVRRDARYLDWRFRQNPSHEYSVVGVEEGGDLLGYAVYKGYGSTIDVVDLLAVEEQVGRELVLGVAERARATGHQALQMWLPLHDRLHLELERFGFQVGAPVTYLGACAFSPEVDGTVGDFRNWRLSMADSDVY